MRDKRFRLDLSSPIIISSAIIILVLVIMAVSFLNMPSPDYSGVSETVLLIYTYLSTILILDIIFIGILGGYNLAKANEKAIEKERERTTS